MIMRAAVAIAYAGPRIGSHSAPPRRMVKVIPFSDREDLAIVGARQPSEVWQEIHLYEPRALVAGSIMPAYKWLFTLKDKADPSDVVVAVPPAYAPAGKVVVASRTALDLVAYLESLKQAPLPTATP